MSRAAPSCAVLTMPTNLFRRAGSAASNEAAPAPHLGIPTGLFYPVIVNRAPNARFIALDSACSHEGCTIPIFDPALRYMECLCHGSQYLIDGTVRRGPANFPLRQFTTHFDGLNALAIEL